MYYWHNYYYHTKGQCTGMRMHRTMAFLLFTSFVCKMHTFKPRARGEITTVRLSLTITYTVATQAFAASVGLAQAHPRGGWNYVGLTHYPMTLKCSLDWCGLHNDEAHVTSDSNEECTHLCSCILECFANVTAIISWISNCHLSYGGSEVMKTWTYYHWFVSGSERWKVGIWCQILSFLLHMSSLKIM